ncbi:MAG: hypothetical protein ACTSUS_04210 [Candidatus Freyarchaeota archaeon]
MAEIVIQDSKLSERELTSSVTASKPLRKYFKSFNLFAKYDEDIYANRSILNIPLLSTVLPLAWLTGADIRVDELDRRYAEAMHALKQEFKKMYPNAPFTTEIIADKLIENEIGTEGTAQLFSGGVDSTYTLITNMKLKPRLVMIWGVEGYPYPQYPEYWKMIKRTYTAFAKKHGLKINFIRTNAREILNEGRIEHDFHEFIYDGTLWATLQHSLVLLPLLAPLSVGRFNHLLIAATGDPTYPYYKNHYASQPQTDERIRWGNLRVKHDGQIHRVKKIMGPIKKYLKSNKLKLRVCLMQHKKLNCSACEKCFETIASLILAGIDPNDCGFEVDCSTFKKMKYMFQNKKDLDFNQLWEWKGIQTMIPERIENDIYGSKEFFEWFRNFNLDLAQKDVWLYRDLYHRLPYPLARLLDILYDLVGINIHEHSPIRPGQKE